MIGAGPAGLAAAYYLQHKGYRQVSVLEASDRLEPCLDSDATETELFKAIRYHHYVVSLFDVSGWPNEIACAINVEQPGYPTEIMCPWPDGEIAASYTVMRQKESEEKIAKYDGCIKSDKACMTLQRL